VAALKAGTFPGASLPDPSYTDLPGQKKCREVCVLEVLISANGDPQQIRPLRLLGYGLDHRPSNAIKKWKFKPPTREDGTPVPIIVPVEVNISIVFENQFRRVLLTTDY